MVTSLVTLSLLASLAHAGSGPWVVGEGQTDLYVGSEARRLEKLAQSTGSFAEEDLIEVGEGISTLGAKAILTYGLLSNTEVDVSVPYYNVRANRDDAALCDAVGLGACKTTRGIGIIATHLRYNALNELYGAPLSLTLGAELRYGDLTAETRERITNLGEGTFDLGPMLSLGRSGALGEKGYWYGFLDAGWRYRFPLVEEDETSIPGSEIYAESDWIAVPNGKVGVGPFLTFFWRPDGVDFEQVDLSDIDRFGALRVLALQGGGKLTISTGRKVGFSASVLRTIYAVNNPIVLSVNAGLTFNDVTSRDQ